VWSQQVPSQHSAGLPEAPWLSQSHALGPKCCMRRIAATTAHPVPEAVTEGTS
jgi:hypothetical protein